MHGARSREHGELAGPRQQTVEPKLEIGELPRLVVGVERLLALPLAYQDEPARIGEAGGEGIAHAAWFAGGPPLEAFQKRCQLVSAAADPEQLSDGNDDHGASLLKAASTLSVGNAPSRLDLVQPPVRLVGIL